MKRLTLIRHAKSSWADPLLNDRDRPLNPRGLRDAPLMGQILRSKGLVPECIISSPALRTRMTVELMGLAQSSVPLRFDARLYAQGIKGLLSVIDALDETLSHVGLVGHNPDLTQLLNTLAGETLQNLPTCATASIVFEIDSWTHILAGSGRLADYDYPKRHSGGLEPPYCP